VTDAIHNWKICKKDKERQTGNKMTEGKDRRMDE
jgi:hypothetical protein